MVLVMFGISRESKKPTNNDSRPVKMVRIDDGIWQIVYADE
jgi:hypothetical protein